MTIRVKLAPRLLIFSDPTVLLIYKGRKRLQFNNERVNKLTRSLQFKANNIQALNIKYFKIKVTKS